MFFQKSSWSENKGDPVLDELATWVNTSGAAGTTKLAAGLIAYSYEVFYPFSLAASWHT